jgi:hypothetical protein
LCANRQAIVCRKGTEISVGASWRFRAQDAAAVNEIAPVLRQLVPIFDVETEKWFAIDASKVEERPYSVFKDATEIDSIRARQLGA